MSETLYTLTFQEKGIARVRAQVAALDKQLTDVSSANRTRNLLGQNKATSKALAGELTARKAMIKHEKVLDNLIQNRVKLVTKNLEENGITGANAKAVRNMVAQNEQLRIQNRIMQSNAEKMVNFGKNTQWAGRQLLVGFTVPLTIAAGLALKMFKDLEKEMVRFRRVYGDTFTTSEELSRTEKQVRDTATAWTQYGVAVSETATVAADAASAGKQGADLIAQINAATKLGVLGELDKQEALKTTIALQSTFKMSNDDLGQSINYLNMLENQTMVTMQDMVVAIPKAGTIIQGLNGDVRDLGIMMASMLEGGVKAAEGANALKSGLGSLLNPSKKAKEELSKVGIDLSTMWAESEENGQGVLYVLEEMATKLERLGDVQRQALIEEMFGKHQFARINALLNNINNTTGQVGAARKVADTSQIEAAIYAQKELATLADSNLTKLNASIERLKISLAPIGEAIAGIMAPLINIVTQVVEKFNEAPQAFKVLVAGVVAFGGIVMPLFLMLLGQFANLIGNLKKAQVLWKQWITGTSWLAEENLTLTNSLTNQNLALIQQNKLLQINTTEKQQNAAVGMGVVAVGGKKIKMATGGMVPGTGNKDTVPALLTPGEVVVKKGVAQKFLPILNAMNSGRIKMFGRAGEVKKSSTDKGWKRNWAPDEPMIVGDIENKIKSLFGLFKDNIESIVNNFREVAKLTDAEAAQLKKDLTATFNDPSKGGPEVSHIVGDVNPVTLKKEYRSSNSVIVPKMENNALGPQNLGNTKNLALLEQVTQQLIVQDKQQIKDGAKLSESIRLRTAVVERIRNGEHIIDDAERKMAAEMVLAARATGKLSTAMQRDSLLIASSLSQTGLVTLGGDKASAAINERESARVSAIGHVPGRAMSDEDKYKADIDHTKSNKGLKQAGWALAGMLPMLLMQFNGVTEKLGKFGNAVVIASEAMMMFQFMGGGDMIGGWTGKLRGVAAKAPGGARIAGMGKAGWLLKGGLGVGAVGGMAGALAGNYLGDKIGGAGGGLVQGMATGAGIGMMFGPWGAGIGAAVGALAGWTLAVKKSEDANKQATEAIKNSTVAWSESVDKLIAQFQLGTGKSLQTYAKGEGTFTDEEAALFKQLEEAIKTQDIFTQRYEDLAVALEQGVISDEALRNEVDGLTLELRGRGIDERSIELIVKAFVNAAPGTFVKTGVGVQQTDAILAGIDKKLNSIVTTTPKAETRQRQGVPGPFYMGNNLPVPGEMNLYPGQASARASSATGTSSMSMEETAQIANILSEALESLNNQMVNLDTTSETYEEDLAALDKSMTKARQQSLTLQDKAQAGGNMKAIMAAAAAPIEALIKNNQGNGLTKEEWNKISVGFTGNHIELSQAAQVLMQAGYDLSAGGAGANGLWTPDQISAMANANLTYGMAESQKAMATAAYADTQKALKDIKEYTTGYKAEKESRATEISLSNQQKKNAILGAKIEIAQINVEQRAMKDFVKKFNKAFNLSVDSFADAQYQIDKIGQRINEIQTKTLDPLQEKIDDLNRANELDKRKLEDLEEKQKERVDAINEAYDKQIDALKRIREQNEFIFKQQQNNVTMADALAQGDVASAVNAMVESNRNVADYTGTFQEQALADQRDAALTSDPYKADIDKITASIEARDARILKIEDQIYQINEKQIEPLQRKSDLMKLMMDDAKLTMEHQKNNVLGIDAENVARSTALTNAKMQLEEAKKMVTVQQEINDAYDERMKAIANQFGIEYKNAKDLTAEIVKRDKDHAAELSRADETMQSSLAAIKGIQAGNKAVIDEWSKPVTQYGLAGTLMRALDYIDTGEINDWSKIMKQAEIDWKKLGEAERAKNEELSRSSGGSIPGTGGRDSVPAKLTPGEYVMRKSAVDRLGVPYLERLNRGLTPFAAGGPVPNYLGTFGEIAEQAMGDIIADNPELQDPTTPAPAPAATAKSRSTKKPSRNIPTIGSIPALGKPASSSGMAAENASWIKSNAITLMRYVRKVFGPMRGTTYMSSGEHGSGKAVDFWPGTNARGWKLAQWGRKWSGPLKLSNIIYDDRIWSRARASEGWRAYQHPSGSRTATDRHLDHVHMYTFNKGGLVPGAGNTDSIGGWLTPGEYVLNKAAVASIGTAPLAALNAGRIRSLGIPAPQEVASTGDVVYNNYTLSFNISEASDADEVASVVLRKIDRATKSRVRNR